MSMDREANFSSWTGMMRTPLQGSVWAQKVLGGGNSKCHGKNKLQVSDEWKEQGDGGA